MARAIMIIINIFSNTWYISQYPNNFEKSSYISTNLPSLYKMVETKIESIRYLINLIPAWGNVHSRKLSNNFCIYFTLIKRVTLSGKLLISLSFLNNILTALQLRTRWTLGLINKNQGIIEQGLSGFTESNPVFYVRCGIPDNYVKMANLQDKHPTTRTSVQSMHTVRVQSASTKGSTVW